ncbi:MAG: glycosyltransferase family 4 protein [Granulosicoccus sp.]|nr:glycosyltransferase family 4 protein [Granulosicoccus sp.]
MRPSLVILTTHFGTNFSGGSTATCEIFSRIEEDFSKINVIANELGEHPFKNINWLRYRTVPEAIKHIRSLDTESNIFYGDFYNAFLFTFLNKPFYFTYHDNWPELKLLGWQYRIQNRYYWTLYRRIFKRAKHVITVSNLKRRQVAHYSEHVSLIRNGFNQPTISHRTESRKNVIMAGNIDARKYHQAIRLFDTLPADPEFEIHIYGHSRDKKLSRKLSTYSFVILKGFQSTIPYAEYSLLLHTSQMENLSIVWCEALYQRTKVLTFDVGAAREVIDGESGWCIPPYDISNMRTRLLNHIRHPTAITETPASLQQYNWQNASEQYKSLLFRERAVDA